jgi:hypothetical protein
MKPPTPMPEMLVAAERLAPILSKHVVPICRDDAQERPEQIGSGLLVAGPDRSHLISAAHVLSEKGLYFHVARGKRRSLKEPVSFHSDERIDLGIIELKDAPPPYPAADKYALPISALLRAATPRRRKDYLITGFPWRRSKVSRERRDFTSAPYANLCVSADAMRYDSLKLSSDEHIVLDFNVRRVYGRKGKQAFPNPSGMSGSPVWLMYDHEGPNPLHTPAVGILIKHCPSKLALVATDIGFAIDMITNV